MSGENEGDTLIPFIDEGEEEDVKGQYNLTITRNYQNKTRRVEISKILQDVEPMTNRSLSPVAPLAYESDTDGGKSDLTELTGAEFELTIKSNNSVIKIQGFDNKSTISFNSGKAKGENVYDFLSKEVDKIFKKPERDEIERAMRSISEKRKLKPICRQKRNTWKALAKSFVGLRGKSNQRRGSIERYPKMVLLQDPKPPPSEEDAYPKMVMFDGNKENEKLKMDEIEKNKTNLGRGKKFLNEKKILKKKMEDGEYRKANLGDDICDRKKEVDIATEEKLCVELEKQLLGEEKDVLRKEKKPCDCDDLPNAKRIPPLEADDLSYTSVPPFYCQFPTHCPYMPVYSRTLPYYPFEFCCSGRTEKKHSGTQTEPEIVKHIDTLDPNPSKDVDLPFGILSSFFPRIVVMKSFQEEVSSDDAQIFEIPKAETPPENEKEDEESEYVQPVELDKEPEEMRGNSMPLTKIGHSIYDKLNELAMERKRESEESAMESGGIEVVETEMGKSTGDTTLDDGNTSVTSAIDDENLKTEKTVVRKSELWHPSNASTGDTAKGSDRICVSVSDNRSVVLTVRLCEERKPTREAKVGTDGVDIAGGDISSPQQRRMDAANLSPRTDNALRSLQNKLEEINGCKKPREFQFPGLFLIQPFDSRCRSFPSDDYIMTKDRERRRDVSGGKPREYYCEECLATMRLIEDENPTVKTMIDKFERIIHLGTY